MSIFKGTELIANVFDKSKYYSKDNIDEKINNISNVKIRYVTKSVYLGLAQKDPNTMYIVQDKDNDKTEIYIGENRIVGGSDVSGGNSACLGAATAFTYFGLEVEPELLNYGDSIASTNGIEVDNSVYGTGEIDE